ncbi:MAG: IclR family transcriptional regulator, partial [Pyrobaculum sp.]
VVYYPFEIKPTPPPPSPTPPAIPQPIPLPYTQTPPERRQPVLELVLSIAVAAGALAYVFWRSKRRRVGAGGCRDLNEVDLTILKKIYESGGSVERAALQSALAIPKTTLHRHLHKLARYGYIRLIQEGQRQKIELLKMC